jgi:hypothetical protein
MSRVGYSIMKFEFLENYVVNRNAGSRVLLHTKLINTDSFPISAPLIYQFCRKI